MTNYLFSGSRSHEYHNLSLPAALYRCLAITLVLLVVVAAPPALAHELRPAIAKLELSENGLLDLNLSLNLEALIAGIGAEHSDTSESPQAAEYERFRALTPEALQAVFDARVADLLSGIGLRADDKAVALAVRSINVPEVGDTGLARQSDLILAGKVPPGTTALTLGWNRDYGALIVHYRSRDGGTEFSAYLPDGETSDPIPVEGAVSQNWTTVFTDYVVLGFTHILPKGLDHVLFVVGLFLLSTKLKPLFWQITSFTVAHSVTLALGMAGIVNLPASIVEPLIAASIVYVAVENLMTDRLQRWRPIVIFGFGLLHGLGFAGVLSEIGLSANMFAVGLIGFNLGVEAGQLAVVALCFLLVGYWFGKKSWYRRLIVVPASLAIAFVGAWWFVERVFL